MVLNIEFPELFQNLDIIFFFFNFVNYLFVAQHPYLFKEVILRANSIHLFSLFLINLQNALKVIGVMVQSSSKANVSVHILDVTFLIVSYPGRC